MKPKATTVAEYISEFQEPQRTYLQQIVGILSKLVPDSQPGISYGMPAWKFHGKPLAYTAAFPNHIGFYATPNSHEAFQAELARYKQGKGSVQFPLTEPLPLDLIEKMVLFRMQQIQEGK